MRIGKCVECGKELIKKDNPQRIWDYQDEKYVNLCKICYDEQIKEGNIEL